MTAKSKTPKRCDPKPLDSDAPSHDWPLDRLTDYAQRFNTLINDGERTLAPSYWHLGHALTLARKSFQRGQWQAYLKLIGIDKTRCSKACAIYKTFSQPEALSDLSVEQAYAERHSERQTTGVKEPEAIALQRFGSARRKIERAAEKTIACSAELSTAEKQQLILELRSTVANLESYVKRLEKKLAAAVVTEVAG